MNHDDDGNGDGDGNGDRASERAGESQRVSLAQRALSRANVARQLTTVATGSIRREPLAAPWCSQIKAI